MAPGIDDDLPDKETFQTDFPIPEEIGCTSSSDEDDEEGISSYGRKRPRIPKPWCDLLFPKSRIDLNPSVLQGMAPERELEFRRYLADTALTLVQKLGLSLDTFSVAVLFMHRFLMYRPVQTIDKRKLALAFVFLASKTTEDRRPPIASFICTFYRLCYRRELNTATDQNVYQRLYQELLFWESQILLVLGFNMCYNLREVRHEIDVFCEEQAHIPRTILRSALCVFVLNTLALTTLPVRCSYRLIYLVSISLTLAWSKHEEPRDLSTGKLWWQFLCMPNQPGVEGFEAIKAEILRSMESTKTKFHDYFVSRQNSNANNSANNSASKSSSRSSSQPSASHQACNGDAEGLTGMPIIPPAHHNGVGASGPSISHDTAHRSHHVPNNGRPHADIQQPRKAEHSSGVSGAPGHKHHHKHHHRDRSERSDAGQVGEHRARKERRSGEKSHRRHSRSSHRREVPDGRGDGSNEAAVTDPFPWDASHHHGASKSASKRNHFSTIS